MSGWSGMGVLQLLGESASIVSNLFGLEMRPTKRAASRCSGLEPISTVLVMVTRVPLVDGVRVQRLLTRRKAGGESPRRHRRVHAVVARTDPIGLPTQRSLRTHALVRFPVSGAPSVRDNRTHGVAAPGHVHPDGSGHR